jgi:hypothetical protein
VRRSGERRLGRVTVAHPVDGVPGVPQAGHDALADHRVVLDQQQAHSLSQKRSGRRGREPHRP